ncbi:MAG TPA: hypothetical protein VFH51_15290 [Myxococcota bacterium]|nr:hypothetical protein [Myxococcota bacterium]
MFFKHQDREAKFQALQARVEKLKDGPEKPDLQELRDLQVEVMVFDAKVTITMASGRVYRSMNPDAPVEVL